MSLIVDRHENGVTILTINGQFETCVYEQLAFVSRSRDKFTCDRTAWCILNNDGGYLGGNESANRMVLIPGKLIGHLNYQALTYNRNGLEVSEVGNISSLSNSAVIRLISSLILEENPDWLQESVIIVQRRIAANREGEMRFLRFRSNGNKQVLETTLVPEGVPFPANIQNCNFAFALL